MTPATMTSIPSSVVISLDRANSRLRHYHQLITSIESRHDPTNIALIPDNQITTITDNRTWQTDRIGIRSTPTPHNRRMSVGRVNLYDSIIAPVVHLA